MQVGDLVKGKVINIKQYGIFIELDDGTLSLCHISEISKKYVNNIFKLFNIGQTVYAKIIEINEELINSPELINEDTFEAWFVKVKPENFQEDSQGLMEYNDYKDEI